MNLSGPKFLHKKDPSLHTTAPVEFEQKRLKRRGEQISQKPADKISAWLRIVEQTHTGHPEDARVLERIKEYYHKEYVINPEEVPEGYFKNQQRLAREQGHGDIKISDAMRAHLTEVIVADQKSTLDMWVDYLSSPDSDSFPMWAKYWAFKGMVGISKYDKEKKAFGKRDKGTTAPFPDLNREALAYVVDAIAKKADQKHFDLKDNNPELYKLLEGANFGKLYAYAIEKVTPTETYELMNTEGQWVKYDQGSDHMPLVKSLQGHGTGWCTAGESTAEAQLRNGDFYVYFSNDKSGKPTLPRAAIRMDDYSIAEVRGIAADQNLDPYIGEVVEEKMNEFPDGKKYYKKVEDMKRVTEIQSRMQQGQKLQKADLRFLYEIDGEIQGFGYDADPRISELLDARDVKDDLAVIMECSRDQISMTPEEAMRGGIRYHHGDLELNSITTTEGVTLPEQISGNLEMKGLTTAKGLTMPRRVGGSLDVSGLITTEGLNLPAHVGRDLDLKGIMSAKGLKLPEYVGRMLMLSSLTTAEGLELPKYVGWTIALQGLKTAEGLKLPDNVGWGLDLSGITTPEGLTLPKYFEGGLDLSSLTTAKGLTLPTHVGGELNLSGLKTTEELTLPVHVGWYLYLSGITNVHGLKLPAYIGGGLSLGGLQTAEGLKLPERIEMDLLLYGLTTAQGLVLPKYIGQNLNLHSLKTAEGLILPTHIAHTLTLNNLLTVKGLMMPEYVGGDIDLTLLPTIEGLHLPKRVRGTVYVPSVSSQERMILKKKYPHLNIF